LFSKTCEYAPETLAMKEISTRFECLRSPVSNAFIVLLDVQLFVGGLAPSSPSVLLPGRFSAKWCPCLRLGYIYVDISRSVETVLRPSLFIYRPGPPLGIATLGDPPPSHLQLSAYKDGARRASSPLFPCRAVALCHPPASSEVAEHSFPFRNHLVARL